MKACIIAVGSEMLTPFRVDTNSLAITERLNAIGGDVRMKVVIGDDVEELARVLTGAIESVELIVCTGGLGPTKDDITREAIARVLGAKEQEGVIPLITRFSLQDGRDPSAFLSILLVEDNAVNQRLAARLLEKRGHRVVVTANGREALTALEKDTFDLVLMDVQMPEMDGLEATAAIRKKEEHSGNHVAVIALTAHAMKGDEERCLAAGMDGYLSKPIRPQELDAILEGYVARRRGIANTYGTPVSGN